MSNITGRDDYIIRKALAYAIETIGRLPEEWQEWSDQRHMIKLLDAMGDQGCLFRLGARGHIERRGVKWEDGDPALGDRPPGVVGPFE